jgi:alanyl-tRNA synthetase
LYQLVPQLAIQFENVFPELFEQQKFIAKVIREEEEAFLRTLEKGLKRIDDIIFNGAGKISGKDAFELYDTYGFPFDLTGLIAAERKCTVDSEGFQTEMQAQKNRSRNATANDTGDWTIINDETATTEFIGYESLETESQILRYRKISSKGKHAYQIILNKTPFYAESGGQVGDKGKLISNHAELLVVDTKKENDLIIHFVEKDPSGIIGKLVASVDVERRNKTALHHSATHLLHAALRSVLGKHVAQKGSLVTPDNLRFDFSHFSKLTPEELISVEKLVNEKIRQNIPVVVKEMQKDEAIKSGATALFGEKYGDQVRVVIIDPDYSIELCGGTHVGATGKLGYLKIISETAIGAGVRRIEALCGEAAELQVYHYVNELQQIRDLLKNPKNINHALQYLIEENLSLKKELASLPLTVTFHF